MTKKQFYEKWKHGASEYGWLRNRESMLNDLDHVVYAAVAGWKDFVDAECQKSVDLDEFLEAEAIAIQNRQ